MTITRKPKPTPQTPARSTKTAAKEKQFIAGAGKQNGSAPAGRQLSLKPVLVNFDQALLDRATAAAQGMGMNRNAFISMCVALYLNPRENGLQA